MEHGDRHITVIDEDGNEELCEILFTFESEKFGKSYVLYYPVSAAEDEDGEIEIMAACFTPGEEMGELLPIETEEEWDMVEEMLEAYMADEEE
jgi:Protein of unknown function (DUF1292).